MNERNSPDVPHGWIVYGDVRLPYVEREHGTRLLARRLVDRYLLSCYPDGYEKQSVSRLRTFQLTGPESELLTKLCRDGLNTCESFSKSDAAVDLAEFDQYFSLVRHAYPGVRIHGRMPDSVPDCGWILVKDSRVPSVVRDGVRLLPLNVLRGAAQVLLRIDVRTTKADPEEVDRLNKLCKSSGLIFKFSENTELVSLADLRALCPGIQAEVLQKDDPVLLMKTSLSAKNSSNVEKPAEIASIQQQSPPTCLAQLSSKQLPSSGLQSQICDPSSLSEVIPPPLIPINNVAGLQDLESQKQIPISSAAARASCTSAEANGGKVAKPATPTAVQQPAGRTGVCHPSLALDVGVKSDVEIVQVECYKRILTCIMRGKLKAKYALVESVMRLFFPRIELSEFIEYLSRRLSVKLLELRRAEERALIRFYGIPTERLHSNLILKVNDFVNRVPWLQQRFGPMDVPASVEGTDPDALPLRSRSSGSSSAGRVAGRTAAPVCTAAPSRNATATTAAPGRKRSSADRPFPIAGISVPPGPYPVPPVFPVPQPSLVGEAEQNAIKKIHGKISQEYHSYNWKRHLTAASAWNGFGPAPKMPYRPYPLPSKKRPQLDLVRSVPRINPEIVRTFGLDKSYLQ